MKHPGYHHLWLAAIAIALGLAGCADEPGPVTVDPVPGEVTLVIAAGGQTDAAAVLELDADNVTAVSSDSAHVFTDTRDGRLRVAIVRVKPGTLRLDVAVRDTATGLDPVLLEVANGSNVLRPSLAGYTVEVRR